MIVRLHKILVLETPTTTPRKIKYLSGATRLHGGYRCITPSRLGSYYTNVSQLPWTSFLLHKCFAIPLHSYCTICIRDCSGLYFYCSDCLQPLFATFILVPACNVPPCKITCNIACNSGILRSHSLAKHIQPRGSIYCCAFFVQNGDDCTE